MNDIDSTDVVGKTPSMIAAGYGKVQALRRLSIIYKGADPVLRDNRRWNSLHWASRCGRVDVIELLLSHMTDIESRTASSRTPLMIAAENGKVYAVKCLISKGADPALRDNLRWNSLHWASRCGHVDVIELLLSYMTDIESRTASGRTPLMIAAENGKLQALKCLISRGADPALGDNLKWNSLHWASRCGHVDVI